MEGSGYAPPMPLVFPMVMVKWYCVRYESSVPVLSARSARARAGVQLAGVTPRDLDGTVTPVGCTEFLS